MRIKKLTKFINFKKFTKLTNFKKCTKIIKLTKELSRPVNDLT